GPVGRTDPGECLRRGRLARAVATEQAARGARLDGQVDPAHRLGLAEADPQVADGDGGRGRGRGEHGVPRDGGRGPSQYRSRGTGPEPPQRDTPPPQRAPGARRTTLT